MSLEHAITPITDPTDSHVRFASELFDEALGNPFNLPLKLDGGYQLYVATYAIAFAGAASVLHDPAKGYAYIHKLAVERRRRNQGIGGALINFAIQRAQEAGYHEIAIMPTNEHNGRLYRRFGFEYSPKHRDTCTQYWLFRDI